MEVIDVAGLVKGASKGRGLGNKFLSYIREVDIICHVLRCFPEKEIVHVENSLNPIRDFEIIQLELISADLQQIEKSLAKLKIKNESDQKKKDFLHFLHENLKKEIPLSRLNFSETEKKNIKT